MDDPQPSKANEVANEPTNDTGSREGGEMQIDTPISPVTLRFQGLFDMIHLPLPILPILLRVSMPLFLYITTLQQTLSWSTHSPTASTPASTSMTKHVASCSHSFLLPSPFVDAPTSSPRPGALRCACVVTHTSRRSPFPHALRSTRPLLAMSWYTQCFSW